jgi:hypothetical protein
MWRLQSCPEPGGGSWSHETRDGPGAALSQEAEDGAMGHVAVLKPRVLIGTPCSCCCVAAGVMVESEVIMGHPTFYALDDIPLDEAMSMAHRALSQAHRVLHWEDEGLIDERQRLQLWATMLKDTTVAERVAWALADLQVEAIN